MNNNFLSNMGIRISERRKAMNLTQEKLANLCLHLNVSADYILYGKRNEKLMNELTTKLSELSPEEYTIVETLVSFLSNRK